MNTFDLIVIGGGIGGYSTAIRAAKLGLKTALIEKEKMGGTCLNVGCIPTKLFLKKAVLFKKLKTSPTEIQKNNESFDFDLKSLVEEKNLKVEKMSAGLTFLIKGRQITIFKGEAAFEKADTVIVNGEKLQAPNIVIASGSYPANLKNLPVDHHTVFNSNSILNLKAKPKSLAIIGGGYIGSEMAFFFNAIGTKVFLIETAEKLLPHTDKDISSFYQKSLQKQGVEILTGCCFEKAEIKENGLKLFFKDKTIEVEKALVAVGRKLETASLKLENISLPLTVNGAIQTNEYMQTSLSNIYAVGDVTGQMQLAHLAMRQGIVAAHNIAKKTKKISYKAVPYVIFGSPEIASVGYTKEQAEQKGIKAKEAHFPLAALGIAIALGETEGFIKLVFEETSLEILGAHFVGENVSYLIPELTLALEKKLTLNDLADTIHPHPTLSEALFETALIGQGLALHMPG